jgi:hypothetical protein
MGRSARTAYTPDSYAEELFRRIGALSRMLSKKVVE